MASGNAIAKQADHSALTFTPHNSIVPHQNFSQTYLTKAISSAGIAAQ